MRRHTYIRPFFALLLFLILSSIGVSIYDSDTVYYELWDISNLENFGGHTVTALGDPQVVSTEMGNAVQFDGVEDRLLVDFNPIMDAKEFTVELIFKPDACYPNQTEPRFLHIQDPDDPQAKRVMIELRINADNQCYLDGFINTDSDNLTLIDETLVHPTEVWQHVAITYKDSTFTTYFNGIKELSGTLHYTDAIVNTHGKTSLGGRMNHVSFYAGLIKTLKVTHTCLEPEDFIIPEESWGQCNTGQMRN
ncbi:MAG: LamG-like jellyroll fold domain-containing protein [Bacteroidales bacterium]